MKEGMQCQSRFWNSWVDGLCERGVAIARRWKAVLLCCLIFALSACNAVSVVDNVSQPQANEIISVLSQHGIGAFARKETGGAGRYSVEVRQQHYSQAVTILHDKGLPGEERASFNQLTAPQGFLPSSREVEALRLDRALAAEVEELLQNHPAISAARVVVRLNFKHERGPGSVSLIVQKRAGADLREKDLYDLLARALPGVAREQMTLAIQDQPVTPQSEAFAGVENHDGKLIKVPLIDFLFGWRIPEDDYNGFALTLLSCFVIMLSVGGVLGYLYGYSKHARQVFESELLDSGVRSLRLERPKKETTEGVP